MRDRHCWSGGKQHADAVLAEFLFSFGTTYLEYCCCLMNSAGASAAGAYLSVTQFRANQSAHQPAARTRSNTSGLLTPSLSGREEPERLFSRCFLVRVDPVLHRQIAIAAPNAGPRRTTSARFQRLEVVLILLQDSDLVGRGHTDLRVHHQLGQRATINQHDRHLLIGRVRDRVGREP